MQVYVRFASLVFWVFFSSWAYAAPIVSIFFVNETDFDYTIKPSAANFCVDKYDTDSFTVASRGKHTFYAALHTNCMNANVTLDYSQTIVARPPGRSVPPENVRMINGTVTYEQSEQDGNIKAKLYIDLTPPVPKPRPVIFRAACDVNFLYCGTTPVTLTSTNLYARFTVVPDFGTITWGLGALNR
jgi:hypothetical protein